MKNKRKIFIILGVLLVLLSVFSLIPKYPSKLQTTPQEKGITNWTTYTNSRFGFLVKYPEYWPSGKEATNGDGKALYEDNLGNEILVYGTNMSSTFSTQNDPVERENIVLDDGRSASLLKLNDDAGKIIYIMFFNSNNQEDKQYVLNATVTKKFFKENEQTLLSVAKSFTLSPTLSDSKSSQLDSAIALVEQEGFTVIDSSKTWYSSSQPLNALIGACAGVEGYCKKTFFFYDGRYLGTDALDPSSQISFVWRTNDTIALNYVLYRKEDSMCCPTAGGATVRFQWDGSKLVALDHIPSSGDVDNSRR